MRPAPAALVIAAKDLRQRMRDRSAITLGLAAPLAIAAIMSFAFKGFETFHYTLGVVNADHGPVATALVKELRQPELQKILTVEPIRTAAAASEAVRKNEVQAALVIPTGFSASITGRRPLALTTLATATNAVAGSTTSAIASSFVAQINAGRLSVATAAAAGADAASLPSLAAEASGLRIPEQSVRVPVGARQLTTISYYAPAMAIFFLLFTVSFTARSFFVDQATGMIDRMRAAPVHPYEILLGKALSAFAVGVVSLSVIALVTSAAFGAYWGPALPAALVGLAVSLAVACLTALVIVLAKTERQAEGIGSIIVFTLALLGGSFVVLSSMPTVLQRLALLTPNGWAMRAYTDLATFEGGVGTILTPLLAILAFSAVVGGAAMLLAPRALAR